MSMTGGISFFDKSKCLFKDGASCVASSNTGDQNLVLGTNKYYRWESIGSDDMTTETITITLPSAVAISRIFLLGHNFDTFQIQYGSSSDFANVTGLDSYSSNDISETGFARDTAYYEFDSVTTDTIILTVDTTQTTDAQKYINQIIVTNEIGTLTGFPNISGYNFDRNTRTERSASGRDHVEKGYEVVNISLGLSVYPVQADITMLESLHDRNEPFLIWPMGGKPTNFKYEQKGFKVGDVFQVQTMGDLGVGFYKNLYKSGVEQSYKFREVA